MTDRTHQSVELDEGFKRGDETILKVTLRRPAAGELRGLSTVDLVRQEYLAIRKILPRISQPIMHEADVDTLSPADLLTIGSECAAFFLTAKDRKEAGLDR